MATSMSMSDLLSGRSGLGAPSTVERSISVGKSTAGFSGDYSTADRKFYTGALDMEPVLCLNVWEHQWLKDYGLLGKRAYLRAWWDRIDWQKVESEISIYTREYVSSYPAPGGSPYPYADRRSY